MRKTIAERFQAKTVPEPNSGCLLWTGAANPKGYGQFAVRDHRYRLAHRVAFELAGGSIPGDACVLHRCDTPACVNPDHLFLGSNHDNMRDMAAKGRQWHQRQWASGRCKRGHDLTDPKNVRICGKNRMCEVCAAESRRRTRRRLFVH